MNADSYKSEIKSLLHRLFDLEDSFNTGNFFDAVDSLTEDYLDDVEDSDETISELCDGVAMLIEMVKSGRMGYVEFVSKVDSLV